MHKVFISYKTGSPNDQEAQLLYNALEDEGFDVFLDKRTFHPGITWDQTIYDNISTSDVLLILITPDAISPWVQREVDFAMGCRISILPVVLNSDHLSSAAKVQDHLAIEKLQYAVAFGSHEPSLRYGDIIRSIPLLAAGTRAAQKDWVAIQRDRWKKQDDANEDLQKYKPTTPDYAEYAYFANKRKAHNCSLFIAAGSITEISDVDVLVNSENVYMQMQRVFERESVSKRIRIDGAKTIGGGHYMQEDTIQNQLDAVLFDQNSHQTGTPVEQGRVIVTTAGHSSSKLSQRHIRFIYHVAVVYANTDREMPVENPDTVALCVKNCLKEIERANREDDAGITSVIFPMLAAGNAGLPYKKSAAAIIEAFKEHLQRHETTKLRRIHLSAYTRSDVKTLETIMTATEGLVRM